MKPLFPVLLMATAAAGSLAAGAVLAQSYPAKPVRLVIPIAPGGGTDIIGRMIAQKAGEGLGQQIIVDNRPGAGGIIGTEVVAKSPGDGYTLLLTPTSHAINPSLYAKLPYDTVKDFAPVSLALSVTTVFVAHPSLPVRTVKDVVALAKSKPGELAFGSAGNGHIFHLTGEIFKTSASVNMIHVPYKGGAPAITALMGGEVAVLFETMLALQPFMQSKRVHPIAVASAQRSPLMPDLPTFAEAGYPGVVAANWYGFFAPAGTPKETIARLNAEITRALKSPDIQGKLLPQGSEIIAGTPEQLGEFLRTELVKWAKAAKDSGAKID